MRRSGLDVQCPRDATVKLKMQAKEQIRPLIFNGLSDPERKIRLASVCSGLLHLHTTPEWDGSVGAGAGDCRGPYGSHARLWSGPSSGEGGRGISPNPSFAIHAGLPDPNRANSSLPDSLQPMVHRYIGVEYPDHPFYPHSDTLY